MGLLAQEPVDDADHLANEAGAAPLLGGEDDVRLGAHRIEELGRTITGDYEGRAPVLISVLKGGSVFLADLIREIRSVRNQHAARFGYDLRLIFEDIKVRQQASWRTYVTFPPRRIEAVTTKA